MAPTSSPSVADAVEGPPGRQAGLGPKPWLSSPPPPVRVFEPRRPGILNSLREAWRFRRFSYFFGQRFMEKRFSRTWLGMLWVPLRPGISLATRVFVYGGLIGIASGHVPYSLAFLVGTAAWQLFYESIYWSVRSIELNRRMIRSSYMPRSLLVFSAVIPSIVDFIVNMSFVAIAVGYYLLRAHHLYIHVGLHLLLVPAGLLLMLLMGLGVGLAMVGVNARARDLRFSLPFVLGFLYFLTPVIYPLTQFPEKYRRFAELNPMTGAVEMVKDGFFQTHSLSPDAALVTVVVVALLWGPLHWFADRREVALLNCGPTSGRARPEAAFNPRSAR
jgi:lipopolysaccharide transport system permease protein